MDQPVRKTAEENRPRFAVMVKPVGSVCNMRCTYCYYLGTDIDVSAVRMSEDTLEKMIRSYIRGTAGPVLSFTWHGGEPTAAGIPFYRKAAELQKKYLPEGWECWNSLQTNGLALDDEWCDFLLEEHFDVGLSIDGTKEIHDLYRKDTAGNGTYSRVSASVKRLKERGIKADLLCTVTSETAKHGREVYRALSEFGTGWMQFIPIVVRRKPGDPEIIPGEPGTFVTAESVQPEAYGRFLKDVFFEWLYYHLDGSEVQLFSEMALVLAGGEASLCWIRERCGEVPVIERDGGVYSCDHFVRDDYRVGSVHDGENALGDLEERGRQRAFGDMKTHLPAKCRVCPHLTLCYGGCPKDRFLFDEEDRTDAGNGPGRYFLCDGLRLFFDYAVPRLKRAIQLSAARKTPQEIMQVLRAEERTKLRQVQRNDPCPCGSGLKFKNCCGKYIP